MTKVAVCIPAFDEVGPISQTVEGVWSCGYPRDDLQVIVAVDGGDPAVLAAAAAAGAETVSVVPNQGSYAARNAAADRVREATVLLFTDAGCLIEPGWVAAHVRALQTAPLSGGRIRFVFSQSPPRPAEWVDSLRHLRQEHYVTREGYAATANLGVVRSVFESLRFDPTLRTGGDAEFGHRAAKAGHAIVYTPDACVSHPARENRAELFKKVRRVAKGAAASRTRRGVPERGAPRPTRVAYRTARTAGLPVSPWWGLRACVLDYRAHRIVHREVSRSAAPRG